MSSRVTQVARTVPADPSIAGAGGSARVTQVARTAAINEGVAGLGGSARVTQVARVIIATSIPTPPAPIPVIDGKIGKVWCPVPNIYDRMLQQVAKCYSKLDMAALKCPWLGLWDGASMPHEAREFLETFTIPTPATGPGVNVAVGWVDVPIGYQCLIYGITLYYTGTGFVEGSGDIIWRVLAGSGWLKGYGNSLTSRGTPSQPFPLSDHTRVNSGSRIWMAVEVPNLSGLIQVGTSNIICALQGWHYPI